MKRVLSILLLSVLIFGAFEFALPSTTYRANYNYAGTLSPAASNVLAEAS